MEASNEAVIIRTDKKMVCFPAQLEPCMSELSILWVSIPTQSCIESRGSKKKTMQCKFKEKYRYIKHFPNFVSCQHKVSHSHRAAG